MPTAALEDAHLPTLSTASSEQASALQQLYLGACRRRRELLDHVLHAEDMLVSHLLFFISTFFFAPRSTCMPRSASASLNRYSALVPLGPTLMTSDEEQARTAHLAAILSATSSSVSGPRNCLRVVKAVEHFCFSLVVHGGDVEHDL
eukprot:767956-Hanusia_phi.AAC.5